MNNNKLYNTILVIHFFVALAATSCYLYLGYKFFQFLSIGGL
ncbi:hypothetical protein [Geobacillus phage GR1]|nr:hypothetical protein [Geobacillus phage GR1]